MKPESSPNSPFTTSASLTLVAFGLHPDEVTKSFGVDPAYTDFGPLSRCGTGRKEDCGLWSYDTAQHLVSPAIEAHLDHLFSIFRPLKSRLEEVRLRPNIFIKIRCAPASILQPLIARRLDARHIAIIADLDASLTIKLLNSPNGLGSD